MRRQIRSRASRQARRVGWSRSCGGWDRSAVGFSPAVSGRVPLLHVVTHHQPATTGRAVSLRPPPASTPTSGQSEHDGCGGTRCRSPAGRRCRSDRSSRRGLPVESSSLPNDVAPAAAVGDAGKLGVLDRDQRAGVVVLETAQRFAGDPGPAPPRAREQTRRGRASRPDREFRRRRDHRQRWRLQHHHEPPDSCPPEPLCGSGRA